jgi:hypothetical protein
MTRTSVVWTGIVGLSGALILTALSLFIMLSGWLPPLLSQPIFVWGLFVFLLFFTLAEIPVMIFGMRRIAASPNPRAKHVALLTNVGFTFFAAVYAVPFILLAGHTPPRLAVGLLLASMAIIRFFFSIVYLPEKKYA